MVILTLNCGSSSAKYQVYDWDAKDVLCVGVVERIGLEYSTIEQKSIGKEEYHERFVSLKFGVIPFGGQIPVAKYPIFHSVFMDILLKFVKNPGFYPRK